MSLLCQHSELIYASSKEIVCYAEKKTMVCHDKKTSLLQ